MSDALVPRRAIGTARPAEPEAIVVGSGKGGVGKSVVSVLLGTALAGQGRRVLLFDADQNLGNLHVLLGIQPAARSEAVLAGELEPQDLVRPVTANLWLLPGDSGTETLQGLDPHDRARLHFRMSSVFDAFDTVVVDAGAGLDGAVRAAAMRASRLLVVTTPEPTALTDAYALMKIVNLQLPALPIDVLVNRALDADDGRAAYVKLATACERFLRRGIRYLGALPEDRQIREAVRDPRRLLELIVATQAARTLKDTVMDRLGLAEPARSAG